jgi:hypothetical protein
MVALSFLAGRSERSCLGWHVLRLLKGSQSPTYCCSLLEWTRSIYHWEPRGPVWGWVGRTHRWAVSHQASEHHGWLNCLWKLRILSGSSEQTWKEGPVSWSLYALPTPTSVLCVQGSILHPNKNQNTTTLIPPEMLLVTRLLSTFQPRLGCSLVKIFQICLLGERE